MSAKELFLSDFYLFGISPFVIDLKSNVGERLEGIPISENGKITFPHHWIEELIFLRLKEGGYLDDWEARIEKLEQADGLENLRKMERWTDLMAVTTGGFSLSIVYLFDGNRLLPVCLHK
jgi:hypothetical protein